MLTHAQMESALINVEKKKIDKLKQHIASLEEEALAYKGRRLLTHNEEKKLSSIVRKSPRASCRSLLTIAQTKKKVNAQKKLEALEQKQEMVRAAMGNPTAGPSSGEHEKGNGTGKDCACSAVASL